jgi:uncharacterized membrane protein YphA (DoxX/SURF4 family)
MALSGGRYMTVGQQYEPRWVLGILSGPLTSFAARLGLTSAYILGGITKLLDFPGAVAEQQHLGLHPGWLWAAAAIVIELVGPALILTGLAVWLGAGALGVLTAIAMASADTFWSMHGQERFIAANTFFEHLGLIGGFALVATIANQEDKINRTDLHRR